MKVVASVPESERAGSVKDLCFDEPSIEQALGVLWNIGRDEFGLKIKVKDKPPNCPTKISSIKTSSPIYKLNLKLEDDLLCAGGQLRNAPIPTETKYPLIVPKNHHISILIAQHYDLVSGHSGLEHALSLIRERFWIVGTRATIRRILDRCISCKRRQALVRHQKMADLPVHRVMPDRPPFTFVGVDCFGPFMIKRTRNLVKRYGVLFTCMVIRAIHIEVAHSLDTDSFLHAMRRFITRRGPPEVIRSDNGGNFVSGEKELRAAIDVRGLLLAS